ncbi:Na+/H+ antiporter subunit E [Nocardiopsis flavescens]|uniref:Multicomponent Na+:H+ antiporter subunit E n=1 Tax=Nocardiopsis flavescens TaxID=758803 RepID=A0A1M6NWY5_9ACTN|nr:Na+/H+ antiporter subunit E [Nocardiopsis flavescens]SHK00245.1 multicomponent Na+:H+ antiporter subunit E [Nocardiopsis flavescens]
MTDRKTAKKAKAAALRRRLGKVQVPVALGMTLVWMLLFNAFQPRWESLGLFVLGFLVSVAIMLVFPLPPIVPGFRFHPLPLVRMVLHIAGKMFTASFRVTAWVFSPGEVHSSVIAMRLRTHSDLMLVCTAIASSIIPGTVIVEVSRDEWTMYLHVLGAADEKGIEDARADVMELERLIVRALGTREDIEMLEAASPSGKESV